MVGRIPVLDVTPQLECGKHPAKATVGEPFDVTATVVREGHDALSAEVVLVDPSGTRRRPVRMHKEPGAGTSWRATVVPDVEGAWGFEVHGWSDPVETWRHDAEIKVPAGIDVELMFTEGALLLERAAEALPKRSPGRKVLTDAVKGLRDTTRPEQARFAAGVSPEVDQVLDQQPVRDLVTTEGPYPFFAEGGEFDRIYVRQPGGR